ncbi:hypothetical protein LMH87_001914 [Akanthomyces muscarius]|uniref:Uncharacterized protein n=1 Tax=Akanthomyces muscarius TaxID=2231603 RepID=A0A9W8Q7G7_AKAMU|nr:hypothetical protein LMH87_001914 [Akanthomyces muscarius]KAJ4147393.1 hypothetical protein LMH87_001914 [Akanthomyces muscarius]
MDRTSSLLSTNFAIPTLACLNTQLRRLSKQRDCDRNSDSRSSHIAPAKRSANGITTALLSPSLVLNESLHRILLHRPVHDRDSSADTEIAKYILSTARAVPSHPLGPLCS